MFKMTALAAALAGLTAPAMADQAETKGGLTVKTDDGRFEFKLGGRFHIDAYAFDDCTVTTKSSGAEAACGTEPVGGMFLRRGYITASGKLYGWKFKSEFDPAASNTNPQNTWREAWVSTEVAGGELIIGQFKPFRAMEELTSSNEILMMERPYLTASALYGGARQFQMGIGYKLPLDLGINGLWATNVHNIHQIGNTANEGIGGATRLTLLPVEADGSIVHVGLGYNHDNFNHGGLAYSASATIAGRNSSTQVVSPTQSLGSIGSGESQSTYTAEAATAIGPFFLQAEYAKSELGQTNPAADQDITSYYAQTSFFLTGETKPYKKDRGTFGTPKPFGAAGAWEVAARYDFIENDDLSAKPEVTQITAGLNWYVNPNVRFMLNYSIGEAETTTTKTELDAVAVRTQLSF